MAIFLNNGDFTKYSIYAIKVGGMYNNDFIANLLTSPSVEEFENWLAFAKLTGNNLCVLV